MSQKNQDQNAPVDDVAVQHAKVQITALSDETAAYQRTTHPDAQWYRDTCLGMFFHWGISSVNGQGDLSWGMMKRAPGFAVESAKAHGIYAVQSICSPNKYWEQAEGFKCENYDPEKWLIAAKEVGVEYVVITTKHHDGFCLWPSEHGDLSTKNFLGGRDLLQEFVAACRKLEIKIGFYYSPPDWRLEQERMSFLYGNQNPGLDQNFKQKEVIEPNPEEEAAFFAKHAELASGHVRELLTRYGKIDILWFDGRVPPGGITMEQIREIQPGILVNSRGYGYGDFNTPECKFPERRFDKGWWEYCHVFADGAWGYLDHEVYKPLGWLLGELSKTRSWDGTFLPNVAPDAKGQMPHSFYLRMRQLKDWMSHSGESIHGAEGGGWPEQSNVPLTHRAGRTYAHLDWQFDASTVVEISYLKQAPKSVSFLKTGESIEFTYEQGVLRFQVDDDSLSHLTDVVLIEQASA
ncbi:alpha-L-fucosidase [Coraliomargarita algicola]|uniref:alpha-L-fucosidase n=1 Tax=Coraliomargarita algicola TaxID=3092156 RepID=A0ABZ0RRP3_9BACT|nr:alpha-L-fucosidase [Coraliomargarita sp. J2-16]WPJ95614.1 alpha-L-fucosidase [Coraliomargarita sp. J2-16]